jgi:hypothetical protein
MRITLGLLAFLLATSAQAGVCVAGSGAGTTALVELYTSEACSSCPPANRWLADLGARGAVPKQLVAVALHVDYSDYLGWKDPHAKRPLSLRQRKLTPQQRLALVYTPQVMLQGRDFRGWDTPAFDEALERINATPARAHLRLEIVSMKKETVVVRAAGEVLDRGQIGDAALYLAAYENRLERRPVVLEWQGPLPFSQPRLMHERELPLLPKAVPASSGVVAFVQNRRSAEVLQVVILPSCPWTFGYIRPKQASAP